MAENISNFHVEYMDVIQHWSPTSEKYAGADSLLTMIYKGWQMKTPVMREQRMFAGMRQVNIYHITLERNGDVMKMPVIHNPYINRMIISNKIQIIPFEKSVQQ